jgi:hypothetical protein
MRWKKAPPPPPPSFLQQKVFFLFRSKFIPISKLLFICANLLLLLQLPHFSLNLYLVSAHSLFLLNSYSHFLFLSFVIYIIIIFCLFFLLFMFLSFVLSFSFSCSVFSLSFFGSNSPRSTLTKVKTRETETDKISTQKTLKLNQNSFYTDTNFAF